MFNYIVEGNNIASLLTVINLIDQKESVLHIKSSGTLHGPRYGLIYEMENLLPLEGNPGRKNINLEYAKIIQRGHENFIDISYLDFEVYDLFKIKEWLEEEIGSRDVCTVEGSIKSFSKKDGAFAVKTDYGTYTSKNLVIGKGIENQKRNDVRFRRMAVADYSEELRIEIDPDKGTATFFIPYARYDRCVVEVGGLLSEEYSGKGKANLIEGSEVYDQEVSEEGLFYIGMSNSLVMDAGGSSVQASLISAHIFNMHREKYDEYLYEVISSEGFKPGIPGSLLLRKGLLNNLIYRFKLPTIIMKNKVINWLAGGV